MKHGGIYKIRNVVTNMVYIGQAKNFQTRWYSHKSLLTRNKHHCRYLQFAWNKYGAENFRFETVLLCPINQEALAWYEQIVMDLYEREERYNSGQSSKSRLGVKHSAEAKAKISSTRLQRGFKKTPEQKARISEVHKGKTVSPKSIAQGLETKRRRKLEKSST